MNGLRSHDSFAATLRHEFGRQVLAYAWRLLLDSRGVEAPMAYKLAFDMLSSLERAYTSCLPRSQCRSYAVRSRGSDEHPGVARPERGGEKRRGGRAPHHEACAALGLLLLSCAATGVSLLVEWCLIGTTSRGQPLTPVVTRSQECDGLRVRRIAGWWTCRAPSLGRHGRCA